MTNQPIATIHLDALQHNLDLARSCARRSKIMAVVKADAYGHGAVEVARSMSGIDALAVARVIEGVALRAAGAEMPIMVLEGFIDNDELDACRIDRLTPVLHSTYQVELLKASRHADLAIWVKVDTGMRRLGMSVEAFRAGMTKGEALNVAGVMSHLANADAPGDRENLAQIEIFAHLTHDLDCELSIANSGAILHYPNSHFDWIRPGIMFYGGSPTGVIDDRLRPGMTLRAPVVAVNRVGAGESIGYGSTWTATGETDIAVVGIGYADGYPREMPAGTPVLVGGQRRAIVGRISMDMTFVLLEPGDKVSPGDHVTLWGTGLPIDEIAACAGTISYTLMSGLTARVRREYDTGKS